jgi:protein TonB
MLLPKPGGYAITVSLLVQAEKQPAKQESTQNKSDTRTARPEPLKVKPAKQPVPDPVPARKKPSTRHVAHTAHVAEKTSQSEASIPSSEIKKSDSITTLANITSKNSQHMEKVLRKAFNAHFYYPRLAIRRGWQGEVRLGLRIEANGSLTRIRILQGSGYNLLDKAAVKSLNKVEILPEAIALLRGHSLDLILPVKYRLL